MMLMLVVPETFVSPEEQLLLFAGSCLLGLPCGVLFDCLRLLRRLIPHHPTAVALEDALFLSICGLLIMGYTSAFAMGDFRMYYVIGCILGFVLYLCTAGRLVIAAGGKLCDFLRRPFADAGRWISSICRKVSHTFVKTSKKTKKAQKITQNPLQNDNQMVYNKNSKLKKVKHNGKNKSQRR